MQRNRCISPLARVRPPVDKGWLMRSLAVAFFLVASLCCSGLGISDDLADGILPRTESGFPDRPIRIVVYTSPGGMIDFTARKFADVARKYAPLPLVVLNKPGAGGVVAFEEVLQMPADGYTMLAVTRSNISKMIASHREDLIDGLDWFAYVMENPHVVITKRGTGREDWLALQQEAIERNGRQLWLGADIGGVKHVSGEKIWDAAGLEARWIPYESGGRAVAALLGGLGSAYLGNPADATGNDDLQIVAVAAPERMDAFPDIPTFQELGIEGLENERIWRGFAFKAGVPPEVLDWYERLFEKVTSDPEWIETWLPEGMHVELKKSDDFQQIIEADREEFQHYLRKMGLLRAKGGSGWLASALGETPGIFLVGGFLVVLNGILAGLQLRSRRKRSLAEILVPLLLASLAAVFFCAALALPPASAVDPIGPAGVPRLWILLLIPLAAWQIWVLVKKSPAPVSGESANSADSSKLFFQVLLALFLYAIAMVWIGYFAASLVFIPVALRLMQYRNIIGTAAITLCWLAFAWLVFEKILFVDLPAGRLFGGG